MQTEDIGTNITPNPTPKDCFCGASFHLRTVPNYFHRKDCPSYEKEFLDTVSMREVPQHIYLKARELEHYMLMNGFEELAGIKLRSYKPNFCGEPEFYDRD